MLNKKFVIMEITQMKIHLSYNSGELFQSALAETKDLFGNPIEEPAKQTKTKVSQNHIFGPSPELVTDYENMALSSSANSRITFSQQDTTPKVVHFPPNTKGDGLRPKTQIFLTYMLDILSTHAKGTVINQLARDGNINSLKEIKKKLVDLIQRCIDSEIGRAPILKGGGNSSTIKKKYIPYLKEHVDYLARVIKKVRTALAELRAAQRL